MHRWLDQQGYTPNQLELARQAGTHMKMASQVVRKLAAKGLIERAIDPGDTRARRLSPTPQGAPLARRAIPTVEGVGARFFDDTVETLTPVRQRLVAGHGGPAGTAC